jgi:hypothetical protein
MRRGQPLAAGGLFRLMPLSDARVGYGQVLARYGSSGGHFHCGVFARTYDAEAAAISDVVDDDLCLFALTVDALLFHGHWVRVGRADVRDDRFEWPEYKVATGPGRHVVEDAFGHRVRPASETDREPPPVRKVVAPIVVQDAFAAPHGNRPWLQEYDHLRV